MEEERRIIFIFFCNKVAAENLGKLKVKIIFDSLNVKHAAVIICLIYVQ